MKPISSIAILYVPFILVLVYLSVSSFKMMFTAIQKRATLVMSTVTAINIFYFITLLLTNATVVRVIYVIIFTLVIVAISALFWYTVRLVEWERIESKFAFFLTSVIGLIATLLIFPNFFTYWSFSILRFKLNGTHYFTYGVRPPFHLYLLLQYMAVFACIMFLLAKSSSVTRLYRRRYYLFLGTIFLSVFGQFYFGFFSRFKTINLTYIFFGIAVIEMYWDCYRSSHQYQSFIDHFLVDRLEVGLVMFNYSDTLESFNKVAGDRFDLDDSMKGKLTRTQFIDKNKFPISQAVKDQTFKFWHDEDYIDGRMEVLTEDEKIVGVFFAFYNVTKEENARLDLEKYSKNRNDFVTTMTHELRTPLNAVIGFSNQLMDKMPKNDYRDQVGLIDKSGKLILRYVDEMTEMMSLLDGVYNLEPKPFKLTEEIDKAIKKLVYASEVDKNIAFELKVDPVTPTVLLGDSTAITTVFNNVVDNAYKYTERGRITAETKWISDGGQKGELEFTVQDTGCGMSEEVLENIYIAFSVGTEVQHKHENGIGIGLFITKKLLDLMGGTIQVESHLNIGTTVKISVPVQVIDNTPISTTEKSEGLEDVELTLDGARILVVEDNRLNARSLKRQLEFFKAEVEVCMSGEDALEKLSYDNKFDLILMDFRMPGINGIETTKRIRSSGVSIRKIPIVAVTADVSEKRKEEFHRAKMNDVMFKPFELKELMVILTRWLPPKKVIISKKH